MSRLSRPTIAAAALSLVLFAGCDDARDRGAEKILEKVISKSGRDGTVELDRQSGSITVTMGKAVVPAGWPRDVPLYPNARRAKIRRGPGKQPTFVMTSVDPVSPVARFYRERLARMGWRVERATNGEPTVRARKGVRSLVVKFSSGPAIDGSRAEIEIDRGA